MMIKRIILVLFYLGLFPFIIVEMTIRLFITPVWWILTGDSDRLMDGCFTFEIIWFIEKILGIEK